MTAEVCIMNRSAAVLAADSATTVRRLANGEEDRRYFKGANKIHQLSLVAPIGIMIFDSADILSVPWEIVVKEFRKQLAEKTFNTVDLYANEFFDYIANNSVMFPDNVRFDAFQRALLRATVRLCVQVTRSDGYDSTATEVTDDNKLVSDLAVLAFQDEVLASALPNGIDDAYIGELDLQFSQYILTHIQEACDQFNQPRFDHLTDISKSIVRSILTDIKRYYPTTGIVFCGFGDHQIFPAMHEYVSCGLLPRKHVVEDKDAQSITHERRANLKAFAQTSMADTFTIGVSLGIFSNLMLAVRDGLSKFAEQLIAAAGTNAADVPNLSELLESIETEIGSEVLDQAREDNAAPMRDVLASLPVDEMAGLAETLVSLQSLKERMTSSSESVSGPIDVAVITKSEGLVWIKRKHFFPGELNARYHLRLAKQLD